MNNIVLIGFMGSGKTTVGKILQEKTGFLLLDSDKEIEKQQGKKISEIFEEQGEAAFRKMESDYLDELSNSEQQIILSTGGGMPLFYDNAERMKKVGKVIYLKASADTIYQRVKTDMDRPLLQTGDRRKTIEELLVKRDPLYQKAADVILETDALDLRMVVDEIIRIIQ